MPSKNTSDIDLVKALKQKDHQAFEVIFSRYWKSMFDYAFKIFRDETICQDIVQEIFVRLWDQAENLNIGNLEAYLIQSVKYGIANHFRSVKFEKEHLDVLENLSAERNLQDIEIREMEYQILSKVDSFSPKCREVFVMSRFDHFSNREIADILNLSVHTVEKHISNGLKILRENLQLHSILAFVSFLLG